MPVYTLTTWFRKGGWERINLGEGNSELASLPPGNPISDIGVTHQIEYP